ncbi:MAG: hypothetical protein K940chlam6_00550 [Chlamydiae bacterium]|nr:hypothetical protein [Chlamydiota bacterium]
MNNNDLLRVPDYFHREYENDLPKQETETEYTSQALRIAKVGLPFIALYQPFGRALASGLGTARTLTNFSQCCTADDFQKLSWSVLQTCLALASVVGTVFLHPMGMFITTFSDIAENSHGIYQAMADGEMSAAAKQTMRVANNSLYLALMLSGSVQLQLASLALQVIIEGSSSIEEFNKGNILETVGHLGMSMIRMNQSYHRLGILQEDLSHQPVSQRSVKQIAVAEPASPRADEGAEPSDFAISGAGQGKWHPALELLEEQHGEKLYQSHGSFSENFHYYEDSSGNLKGVWLCEDQNWNFTVRSAFYNSQTRVWSQPIDQPLDLLSHFSFGSEIDRKDVFLELQMDSFGSVSAMCILPADYCLDQPGLLQVVTFDQVKNAWISSPQTPISGIPYFAKNTLAALKADDFGNVTAVWYDSKANSLESIHYEKGRESWSPVMTIDSGIHVNQIHLFPISSGGVVAIWKEEQVSQNIFFEEKIGIRGVIRSSNYSPIERSWTSPFDIMKPDSLRLRTIKDLHFQIDSYGNIVMVWEEEPARDILEFFQIVQCAKNDPKEFDEWLFGDDDLDDEDYKKKLAFKNFLDSIHSFEDYIRKMMNYKGSISVKEFLKLNDPHGDYSVAGSVFDAKTGSWSNTMLFSSHGRSPKVELTSGKALVSWLSYNDPSTAANEKAIDQYTDQEIDDIMFGRCEDPYEDMDDEVGEYKEYIQSALYDPETKNWVVDSPLSV